MHTLVLEYYELVAAFIFIYSTSRVCYESYYATLVEYGYIVLSMYYYELVVDRVLLASMYAYS